MSNFLSLRWRCDININFHYKYHRIDFDTETITSESNYEIFHSFSENPQPDDWYSNAPIHAPNFSTKVGDNIQKLLTFVNVHTGNNSGDYINLKSSIRAIATSMGIISDNDGKRSRRKNKRSRRKSKRSRRKSKRRKRKI